jgi:hypothetical protein
MSRSARPAMRTTASATLVAIWAMIGAGCGHIPQPQWPWHRAPSQAPEVVHELVITGADGTALAYPQYFKGNTLVVDLRLAAATGSIVLKPREHTVWPVRISFRVLPGQFGELEVHAYQRVVLPVTTAGTRPVDLDLAPGVFIMKTPQITVQWGPATQPSADSHVSGI